MCIIRNYSLSCYTEFSHCKLQNDDSATLDMPPNIKLFNAVSAHTLISKSPVLQARLDQIALNKSKTQASAAASVPNFNFVLPNEMFKPFIQQPLPTAPTLQPSSLALSTSTSLIPVGYQAGPRQSINEFCCSHHLSASILEKFKQNALTGTHAFCCLNESDLQAMNFKTGEIIDVSDAVEEWAVKIG